ncbi:SubName: Full=Uncharacterized protein {ECO:0000313/EMBL:CCA72223.1} [Serendipita indica DSM 11827]|nr:SubName: Full=Uncharacterized protein {ECO:0000313/EMBL:CCA72223.1} [Serendipita indica DSM 11827]
MSQSSSRPILQWSTEQARSQLTATTVSIGTWNGREMHFSVLVYISDVLHGVVPAESLRRAYRIYISMCKRQCRKCRKADSHEGWTVPAPRSGRRETWNLEILEMDAEWDILIEYLSRHNRLANLGALIRRNHQHNTKLESICSLRFYYGLRGNEMQHLNNITTLQLQSVEWLRSHSLPQLRHLSIYLHTAALPEFVTWLQDHGYRLLTLYCQGIFSKFDVTPSIWLLCPEATALQLPPTFKWIPPPSSHPITHLRLDLALRLNLEEEACSYCGTAHPGVMEFPVLSVEEFIDSGICQAAFNDSWSWMVRGFSVPTDILCLVAILRMHGVLLVDKDHLTIEDYWVAELEVARWGIRDYTNVLFGF